MYYSYTQIADKLERELKHGAKSIAVQKLRQWAMTESLEEAKPSGIRPCEFASNDNPLFVKLLDYAIIAAFSVFALWVLRMIVIITTGENYGQ